jgi:Spy/CpxP family protein refolding chaperone
MAGDAGQCLSWRQARTAGSWSRRRLGEKIPRNHRTAGSSIPLTGTYTVPSLQQQSELSASVIPMKSFVKVLISVLALGVMASAPMLRAQEEKAPPAEGGKKGGGGKGRGQMSPEQRVAAIETAVGTLTAEQKTKITAILEKSQKDMMALGQEATREQRMEVGAAANKEIRAVLTAEQQTKFDAMPPMGGGGRGGKKKQN